MAKRNTTTRTNGNGGTSKAEAVRQYHKEHPDAGPKEIAEALTKKGVEVTAGRVSAVLRSGGSKVDVDTIKRAAEFVANYKGSIKDALKAIETVGGFVEACGGADKAKAALEAYEAVAAAVK
jgi:hypothetical protein